MADFVHRFVPGASPSAPTLLLLHGTGGNEDDLVPLAAQLLPGAAILSPRGQVLENGMPRFFRRLSEGVFDVEDLRARTAHLADFVRESSARYGLERVVAVGFSNGANVAGSLLLLNPGVLAGAVLWRAMVPLVPDPMPSGPNAAVLLSNGRNDPLVAPEQTERLTTLLRQAGCTVTLKWQNAGHNLTQQDVDDAKDWIQNL